MHTLSGLNPLIIRAASTQCSFCSPFFSPLVFSIRPLLLILLYLSTVFLHSSVSFRYIFIYYFEVCFSFARLRLSISGAINSLWRKWFSNLFSLLYSVLSTFFLSVSTAAGLPACASGNLLKPAQRIDCWEYETLATGGYRDSRASRGIFFRARMYAQCTLHTHAPTYSPTQLPTHALIVDYKQLWDKLISSLPSIFILFVWSQLWRCMHCTGKEKAQSVSVFIQLSP